VQVAAWLVLVQVKNKRERSSLVRPPGVEKTSRLRSRDPVASGVKCGPHGGMSSKMKSWTVSWLSLKTKVETGLRGSRVMSRDWRAFYIFAIITDGKHSKTTLRIAPTYLPLLFETTFKYILFADVARQRVHFF
jgi:hypothetical protein